MQQVHLNLEEENEQLKNSLGTKEIQNLALLKQNDYLKENIQKLLDLIKQKDSQIESLQGKLI